MSHSRKILRATSSVRCAVCTIDEPSGAKLQRCAGCSVTYYCSKEHQAVHWKNGHKKECKQLSKSKAIRDVFDNAFDLMLKRKLSSFKTYVSATPEVINHQADDYFNQTLLFAAIDLKLPNWCEFILTLEGVNINLQSKLGMTPIHMAIERNLRSVVKMLAQREDVDINKPNKELITPLHFAAHFGDMEITKLIVDTPGCELNKKDQRGYTPLRIATNNRNHEVVELLKSRNCILDEMPTPSDLT